MTFWAHGDQGETVCPTPGMLMIVARDKRAAAAFAPASDVNVSKVPEMRSVGMLLATGSRIDLGAAREFPDIAAVFLNVRPAADTFTLHRGRIIWKCFSSGRGEFLRRPEVILATGGADGQTVTEGRCAGMVGWRSACAILSDRLRWNRGGLRRAQQSYRARLGASECYMFGCATSRSTRRRRSSP